MAIPTGLWAALVGYALGSAQVLAIDWLRDRAQHRRQLRLFRAELGRLSGFQATFGWRTGALPPSDTLPNPPRVTPGYLRLVQEVDFWLTDEHSDDNTQQGIIDITDGCAILERYVQDVLKHVDRAGEATSPDEKAKWRSRAIETAIEYDKVHARWLIMVNSAVADVQRRLKLAATGRQLLRAVRPMSEGTNPPSLPPVSPGG